MTRREDGLTPSLGEGPAPGDRERDGRDSDQVERALATLARSAAFFDQLEDVVLVVDGALRLVDCNEAASRHLGLRLPDDVGQVVTSRIDYEASPTPERLAALTNRDHPWSREAWHVDAQGRRRFGRTTVFPLADTDGAARFCVLWRDGTAERLLRESSWRGGASGPAPRPTEVALMHELLGSIAGLKNALFLAREELAEDPVGEGRSAAGTHLALADRELDRLARFGANLRKLRGNDARQPIPIELGLLLQEVVAIAEPHARQRNLVVAAEVDELLQHERVPEDETWEALKNVLLNAIQHSPPKARVDIVAKVGGPGIVVDVADRGPGIPAALARTIYEPFYTDRPEGTGLGLATARAAVTSVGGYIEHHGRPGGGSVFRVAVPTLSD